MFLSVKKSIFLLLLASFQVLMFFTVYFTYEWIIVTLFLLFLLFYFYYFHLRIVLPTKVLFLWLLFLFSLVGVSFFTHSVPLTLDKLIFFFASFSIFLFFHSLGSIKLFDKKEVVLSLLLLGLVLAFFFLIFLIFPDAADALLLMNIFTIHNGHSHFASILLMFLPLAWWLLSCKECELTEYVWLVLILFYSLLILTFGRFAIFISLLQLPVVYWLFYKKQIKKKLLILSAFLLSIFFISVFFSFGNNNYCYLFGDFRVQVCKSISSEARPTYFKHALAGTIEYPLVGYGPGTFSLVTEKVARSFLYSSNYAHNHFLQLFAETGIVVGSFYLLLVGYLFWSMYLVMRRKGKYYLLNSFLLLSIASSLLNSLMDFDWEIFTIFQMTMILMGLLMWEDKFESSKDVYKHYSWLLIFPILVIVCGTVLGINEVFFSMHRQDLAFNFFPYFNSELDRFLRTEKVVDEQRKQLYSIYRNHPRVIEYHLDEVTNEERLILYKQLMKLEPWQVNNLGYYHTLLTLNRYAELGREAYKGLEYLLLIDREIMPVTYKEKKRVFDYLLKAVWWHHDRGEMELYNKYYDLVWSIWDGDRPVE